MLKYWFCQGGRVYIAGAPKFLESDARNVNILKFTDGN